MLLYSYTNTQKCVMRNSPLRRLYWFALQSSRFVSVRPKASRKNAKIRRSKIFSFHEVNEQKITRNKNCEWNQPNQTRTKHIACIALNCCGIHRHFVIHHFVAIWFSAKFWRLKNDIEIEIYRKKNIFSRFILQNQEKFNRNDLKITEKKTIVKL